MARVEHPLQDLLVPGRELGSVRFCQCVVHFEQPFSAANRGILAVAGRDMLHTLAMPNQTVPPLALLKL